MLKHSVDDGASFLGAEQPFSKNVSGMESICSLSDRGVRIAVGQYNYSGVGINAPQATQTLAQLINITIRLDVPTDAHQRLSPILIQQDAEKRAPHLFACTVFR